MFIQIPNVLTPAEVQHCRQVLGAAQWVGGHLTAGDLAAQAKNNLQIPVDSAEARELGELILHALGRNASYHSAALPLRVLPPRFNRYDVGMTFGAHVDNAIQTVPGTGGMRMRADVSSTIFLSDPDEYDGGELVVEHAQGERSIKLPVGHMIVYHASSLHRVMPVTRGSRWAAFFWAQSLVKDEACRTTLYELDRSIMAIRAAMGDAHPAVHSLVNHYHNLLRRWSEL